MTRQKSKAKAEDMLEKERAAEANMNIMQTKAPIEPLNRIPINYAAYSPCNRQAILPKNVGKTNAEVDAALRGCKTYNNSKCINSFENTENLSVGKIKAQIE